MVLWLYRVMEGDHRYVIPVAALLAIAGGFRQQTLILMIPLALFAMRKVKFTRLALAMVVGFIICLSWFVPLVQNQGGVGPYLEISKAFSDRFMVTTSILHGGGWLGIRRNFIKLFIYTLYAWSIALVPACVYIGLRLWRDPRHWNWEKVVFFLFWFSPFIGFYLFIHMGQQGQVFVFLPALCLISAVGLIRLLNKNPYLLSITATILILFNVGIFCLLPEYRLGSNSFRLLTRDTLVNSDQYFQDRCETIKKNFTPESTIILASSWHHVEYYLPDYTFVPFNSTAKWEIEQSDLIGNNAGKIFTVNDINQAEAVIVIFDPQLEQYNESDEIMEHLPLPNGENLTYIRLSQNDQIFFNENSYGFSLN